METAKEFLATLVPYIITEPAKMEVSGRVDEKGVLLMLRVSKRDMGIIIGRKGATANGIRDLLRLVGRRENLDVNVKFLEPIQ